LVGTSGDEGHSGDNGELDRTSGGEGDSGGDGELVGTSGDERDSGDDGELVGTNGGEGDSGDDGELVGTSGGEGDLGDDGELVGTSGDEGHSGDNGELAGRDQQRRGRLGRRWIAGRDQSRRRRAFWRGFWGNFLVMWDCDRVFYLIKDQNNAETKVSKLKLLDLNVKKMRSREQKEKGFYEVLDWVEKKRPQYMHQFWRCVFEDHILQLYPTLRILRNSLLDGTFKLYEKPPDVETLTEEEESEGKGEKGKKKSYTRKRSKDDRSSEDSDDPGPSSASTPKRRKPAKKPSFSSPVKKGDKQEIWMWPIYKIQLPVTCGDKEGTLYRDKLPEGKKCILSQGRWFTPADFEKFAGKEKCKNWKSSIRCRNTPLKKLIENMRFPVSSSESSSADLETSSSLLEESDSEDFQEQGGRGEGTEFRGRVEEEEEEEDMADLSTSAVFQAFLFTSQPCVSLTGTLYKYRFAVQDSEFGRMGARVKQMFEEEFQKIFSIQ
ncbi:hypothetical protein cypCar_00034378, partial [Cyprinus carpio]